MLKYCKAYMLSDLRTFSDWPAGDPEENHELSDDAIVFVWENLTVTTSCFDEAEYLVKTVTPVWEAFCRNELQFEVPADLRHTPEDVQSAPE